MFTSIIKLKKNNKNVKMAHYNLEEDEEIKTLFGEGVSAPICKKYQNSYISVYDTEKQNTNTYSFLF